MATETKQDAAQLADMVAELARINSDMDNAARLGVASDEIERMNDERRALSAAIDATRARIVRASSHVFGAQAAQAQADAEHAARLLADVLGELDTIAAQPGAITSDGAALDWMALHNRAAFYRACMAAAQRNRADALAAQAVALEGEYSTALAALYPARDEWLKADNLTKSAKPEFRATPEYAALEQRTAQLFADYDACEQATGAIETALKAARIAANDARADVMRGAA